MFGLRASMLVAVLILGACSSGADSNSGAGGSASSQAQTSTPTKATPAALKITPADGAVGVRPDAPVLVSATGGTVSSVVVKTSTGEAVPGVLSEDKTSWKPSAGLKPKTKYLISATAVNADGESTSVDSTLTTLTPKGSASFYFQPTGGTVGVGMPVVVQFTKPVDKAKQALIERGMTVTAVPATTGAWGWLDSKQLIWRPATYWKPGTKVSVQAKIGGIETQAGLWTSADDSVDFTIGDSMISTVDITGHTMTVRKNGAVLKTIPVTTGKPGFETRNGVKVILSREKVREMRSETTGIPRTDPEGYAVTVNYAMRLTWSGEFVHGAPWSVASQGNSNVSHGCTGMSDANAGWFYNISKQGDVVKYVNSKRPLELYNGYNMWNIPLSSWAKYSALD